MQQLPKSRSNDILTCDADKELLIYDLKINKAYSLNETLTLVYQNCNGATTFDELKFRHKLEDETI